MSCSFCVWCSCVGVLQAVLHYTDLLRNRNTQVQHGACLALKSLKVSHQKNGFILTCWYLMQSKVTREDDLVILEKISVLKKCYSFELSIHQGILKMFSTLIIIRNVSWEANRYIRMISGGSCDTGDRSNDAENSALIIGINYMLKYIQWEKLF